MSGTKNKIICMEKFVGDTYVRLPKRISALYDCENDKKCLKCGEL